VVSTILVSISTVFLRQHSILDIFAAIALCIVCYVLVFFVICRPKKDKNAAESVA
jgi:membrane-associated phospholipid phosphatase